MDTMSSKLPATVPKPSSTFGLAVGAVLFAAGFTGCAATNSASSTESYSALTTASSTPPSAPASQAAPDDSRLLIEPGDIDTAADTFATRSSTTNPDGMHGVSALFVNQHDTRAIANTILILPDAAAAATVLNTTVSSIGKAVAGGSPQPSPVGTGGIVVSGTSPDGSKAVTVLLFTQGRAVVRLEFDSAPGDPMPSQFVTDVGKKQEIAIRGGLPS
jgi:hypothetical protein